MKQKTLLTKIIGISLIIFGCYCFIFVLNDYDYYNGPNQTIFIASSIIVVAGTWLVNDYKKDNSNPNP